MVAEFRPGSGKRSAKPGRIQRFLAELKRRKVFQVTSVYLVAAWGLSAGGAEILPALGLPNWVVTYLVISLFAATPLVILIAWLYEFSDRGIERDLGPSHITEQKTLLADEMGRPALTADWQGKKRRFVTDFDIGRDDACAMQLVDPMVSRRHARVEYRNQAWHLFDLGSANGTKVNGEKVQAVQIQSGALITFYPGGAPLVVEIEDSVTNQPTQIALE